MKNDDVKMRISDKRVGRALRRAKSKKSPEQLHKFVRANGERTRRRREFYKLAVKAGCIPKWASDYAGTHIGSRLCVLVEAE